MRLGAEDSRGTYVLRESIPGALIPMRGWLKREFYPTLARAGARRFRFHDLRHFAVSQLIAQGANILEVARVAGHADPSITLRVYGHLMEGALAQAAERYDPLRDFVHRTQ